MTGAGAGNGKSETDHLLALECPHYLAPDLFSNHKHPERHQLGIAKVPNFFLQRHTGSHFIETVTLADGD